MRLRLSSQKLFAQPRPTSAMLKERHEPKKKTVPYLHA